MTPQIPTEIVNEIISYLKICSKCNKSTEHLYKHFIQLTMSTSTLSDITLERLMEDHTAIYDDMFYASLNERLDVSLTQVQYNNDDRESKIKIVQSNVTLDENQLCRECMREMIVYFINQNFELFKSSIILAPRFVVGIIEFDFLNTFAFKLPKSDNDLILKQFFVNIVNLILQMKVLRCVTNVQDFYELINEENEYEDVESSDMDTDTDDEM